MRKKRKKITMLTTLTLSLLASVSLVTDTVKAAPIVHPQPGRGPYPFRGWHLYSNTSEIKYYDNGYSPLQNWNDYVRTRNVPSDKKRSCEESDWIAINTLGIVPGRFDGVYTKYGQNFYFTQQSYATADSTWIQPFYRGSKPSNWDQALPIMRQSGVGVILVCSKDLEDVPPPPKNECDPNNPGSVEATEKETRNYSNIPYALYTRLSEVIPKDLNKKIHGEDLKKWKETHHAQDSDIIYTHSGEFLQRTKSELVSIMKERSKERSLARWEDYKKRLQAEIDKDNNDNTAKSSELQLDDKNKEGLALGGAFTVTEKRSTQQISYNIDRRYKKTWGCVNINGTWKWATVSNSQASSWLNAVDEAGWRYHKEDLSVDVQDNSDKPKLTKQAAKDWAVWRSWQFLNARCNKDEVEAVIRALGGGDNSVTTKEGSGTVYTPVVKRKTAEFFGNPNHSNPALKKTSEERFYSDTSSCEKTPGEGGKLLCEATPGNDSSNDNVNNVQNRGTSLTNTFGAQSLERDNLNKVKESSNIFKFFRDNVSNPFRLDVWHPTGSNNADFDINSGQKAEFTQFVFSKDGTPADSKFTFEDKSKNKILDGTQLDKKTTVSGQENRFHARSSWSSDKEKPHKANIRYAYNVKVINNYPGVITGKGAKQGTNTKYTSLLPTYCDVVFNSTEKHAPKVDNKFNAKLKDLSFPYDGKNPNKDLILDFVRSGEE